MMQFLPHFHHQCSYLKCQLHSFERDHEENCAIHIDQIVPTINWEKIISVKANWERNIKQIKKQAQNFVSVIQF